MRKLVAQNLAFSENNYNKLNCVNYRAFHAASCGILFFNENLLGHKKNEVRKKEFLVRVEKKTIFSQRRKFVVENFAYFDNKRYTVQIRFTL